MAEDGSEMAVQARRDAAEDRLGSAANRRDAGEDRRASSADRQRRRDERRQDEHED